jgi:hypothetical protein
MERDITLTRTDPYDRPVFLDLLHHMSRCQLREDVGRSTNEGLANLPIPPVDSSPLRFDKAYLSVAFHYSETIAA